MAANTDNTQINSFYKGMNSDLSYSMIQDGQYVRGENVRVTGLNQVGEANLTNGVGEIRPIEGVKITESNIQPTKILATGSIRDIGVIVYQDSVDNIWKVGVFKNGHPDDIQVIFNSEEEPQTDKFSIVLHHEIEDLDKLYIADGINPILLVLIKWNGEYFVGQTREEAESYPKYIYNPLLFAGLVDGQLKSGVVQYAYRLYSKYSIATDMSPTTNLIPIVNKDTLEGYKKDYTSNCGVELFAEFNTKYKFLDRILIYRIHYHENGQLPIISMVYDDYIEKIVFDNPSYHHNTDPNGNVYYIHFIDRGTTELGQISLEEFNSMSGVHIIPKVIENKNDYLFAAQIKDVASDVFNGITNEQLGVTMEEVYATLVGDASLSYQEQGAYPGWGRHNTIKRKIEGENWNIFDYSLPDNVENTFEGYKDPSIKYNPTYSNPSVSYYLKSLRRGETYRYGIVLYDISGNSSGAIHICDYTVKDTSTFSGYGGNKYELRVHPVGLRFHINWLPENCVAYEIVRCRRTFADMHNISQGVISKPLKKYRWVNETEGCVSNYPYTPSGFITMQNIRYTGNHIDGHRPQDNQHSILADNFDESNIVLFVSPEVVYSPDQFKAWMKNIDYKLETKDLLYNDCGYQVNGWYIAAVNNAAIRFTQYGNSLELTISAWPDCYWGRVFYKYRYTKAAEDINDEAWNWEYVPPTDLIINETLVLRTTEGLNRSYPTVKNIKQKSYTYIKLYNIREVDNKTFNITASMVANDLLWNDIFESTTSDNVVVNKYEDFTQNIGTEEFNNVILGAYYGSNIATKKDAVDNDNVYFNTGENRIELSTNPADGSFNSDDRVFAAAGGRTAVLQLSEPIARENIATTDPSYMYTYLCNIQKDCTPYGGEPSKTDVYYSHGQYFKADQKDGIVFDGDTYILPLEYVSMHKIYFPTAWDTVPSHMIAYSIPVETSINMSYADGDELSKEYTSNGNITNIQTEPSNVYGIYSQDEPLYSYNTVYSTDTTARLFAPAEDEEDTNAQKSIDYRVMHSNIKSNGEYIDSWLKYQPANYIDVESKYGQITHLRNFHNKLLFWQEQATGLLSVNERVQISDDNNLPLILGTGGVLDRYDYLDDTAGMKKEQYCDAMSDTTLYWYDDDNNEMRAYADGSGIVQLNKVYGTLNLMHEYDDDNIPWMFYDKKYNEAVLDLSNNPKWSIAYNEQVKAFTSLYNVGFDGAITFKDGIYLLNTQSGGETAVEIITKKVPKKQDNQNQQELQTQPAPVVPRRNKMTPIDLGLSVKWGDRYLEAPDEYSEGLHTGWGDITGNVNGTDYSKYTHGQTNISGNPQYDIATAKLGAGWRLPTREEYLELVRSEDLTWYYNYNAGYFRAEAKNGNSVIFAYTSIKENDGSPVKDSRGAILFNSKNHMYAWLGDVMKSFPDSCAYDMNIHILSPEKTDEKQILKLSYWDTPVGSTVCNKLCVRPVYDGPDIEEEQPIIMPTPILPQPIEPEYETIQEVKYITSGANLQLGKWNEGDVTNFDGKIKSRLQYVVNKNPLTTKVFDNQEIISDYHDNLWTDHSYFTSLHKYNFKSDLNESDDVYHLMMTTREGNYRYAVPRAKYQTWGNRIRGKYMLCTIESAAPEVEASIKYIITKFRTSWS